MKKTLILCLITFTHTILCQYTFQRSLDGVNIWSLAYDFSSVPKIYAGSTGSTARIFRTTNLGNSWDTIASGGGQTIFSISFDSLGNMFVANNNNGLLKSTNGGLNFITIPTSVFGGSAVLSVACGRSGYVYAGTNNSGLFRSTDGGSTFTNVLPGLQVIVIKADVLQSSNVYVGTASTTPGPNGFYRSTDWGATFSVNLNPNKSIYDISFRNQGEIFTVATTSPGFIDRSTDYGLTWNNLQSGYVLRGITSLVNGVIFVAGNGGVYYSGNNGVTLNTTSITSSSTPVISLVNLSSQYIFAGVSTSAGGQNGVWRSVSSLSSVNSQQQVLKSIKVFPNPFNSITTVYINLPIVNGFIDIFSADGRFIKRVTLQGYDRELQIPLDFSSLASGIYFLNFISREFNRTIKLLSIK